MILKFSSSSNDYFSCEVVHHSYMWHYLYIQEANKLFPIPQPLCIFLTSFCSEVCLLIKTAVELLFSHLKYFDCSRTERRKINELVS